MQIKAEVRLIADIEAALRAVSLLFVNDVGNLRSLTIKQDLLHLLLEDEQTRLIVWLYPLDHERRHLFTSAHSGKAPSDVNTVWDPVRLMADQTSRRFSLQS